MSVTNSFGDYLKQRRLERQITLRTFCAAVHQDPANYSKLERGKLPPPRDPAKLEPYRKALGIEADSEQWREMLRLAALDRGELPPSVLSDKELMGKLPALFRTLEGDPVDDTMLDELVAVIRRE